MVHLVVFINLFFIPLLPLYLLGKKMQKPLELSMDLLCQYAIVVACNIPLTKAVVLFIRKAAGISISIDSGYYTLAAFFPTILAYIVYFYFYEYKGPCSCRIIKTHEAAQISRDNLRGLEVIVSVLGGILVALSLGISFYMNCVGRSFWIDEVSLARNILMRDIWHLTSEPLIGNQSAPILYLYVVKIVTVLFGGSEFVFRVVAYGSYVGVVILSYCFLKKMLAVPYPILGCGFVASLSILMKYASELKQYMTEAFCVLLLFYLYAKYIRGEFRWRFLVLCLTIGIWAGHPCCFAAGAILTVEFLEGLWKKNYKRTIYVGISGCVILLSFGLYYLYWLKPVIDAGGMTTFWAKKVFPLLFFTGENRKTALALIRDYLDYFGVYKYMIGLLSLVCLFGALRERKKENIAILITFLLALFASSLGYFPLQDRICLFAYPLLCITSYYSIGSLFREGRGWAAAVGLLLCILFISSSQGVRTYSVRDNIYRDTEEINPVISYLEDHVTDQDKVYVFNSGIETYAYKTGMDLAEPLVGMGQEVNNVFLGSIVFNSGDIEKVESEIDYVSGQPRIYILTQHIREDRIGGLVTALRERGYFELIKNDYDTPLYYFCQTIRDSQAMCEYELLQMQNTDTTCTAKIRIHNTGTAYLGNGYDKLRFLSKENTEMVSVGIPNIRPGEHYDVNLTFDWDDVDEVSLQLWLDDQYWFDELGVSPLKLERNEKG